MREDIPKAVSVIGKRAVQKIIRSLADINENEPGIITGLISFNCLIRIVPFKRSNGLLSYEGSRVRLVRAPPLPRSD